jgi:AcrR family transcriptional regulator
MALAEARDRGGFLVWWGCASGMVHTNHVNAMNIRCNVKIVNMASEGAARRDQYHHGALREALIEGARRLLIDNGVVDFSLSELARRVGVSPAATYRHFANRDALLSAVAERGYEELLQALEEVSRSVEDSRNLIHHLGLCYMTFAIDHPEMFALMFSDRYHIGAGSVRDAAFQPLLDGVAEAQRTGVLPAGIPVPVVARTMWAVVHGMTVLHLNGGLNASGIDDTPRQLSATAWAVITGGVMSPDQ